MNVHKVTIDLKEMDSNLRNPKKKYPRKPATDRPAGTQNKENVEVQCYLQDSETNSKSSFKYASLSKKMSRHQSLAATQALCSAKSSLTNKERNALTQTEKFRQSKSDVFSLKCA